MNHEDVMTTRESVLAEWLGELTYAHEHTFDWIEKDAISKKINAIYVLLDIDKQETGFFEVAQRVVEKCA